MARAVIGQLERAAIERLDTEVALSRAAMTAGGNAVQEREILQTWTDYYVAAIATTSDIETGGSSPRTTSAIHTARERVRVAGAERVALIR